MVKVNLLKLTADNYYLEDPSKLVPLPHGFPNSEEEQGPEGGGRAVAVEDFLGHVIKLHADGDKGFSREYNEILRYSMKSVKATHKHSSDPDNRHKNRYLDIVAYDHSRVILSQVPGQKKSTDYINANYIDGFQKIKAYIGSQGPLDETVEAFWQMIWEQNVYVVVMITNLVERGRNKCHKYWPMNMEGNITHGHFEVTIVKEDIMANFTVRTLKLKHTGLKKNKGVVSERLVKQYHYTTWPDHGTPSDTLPVFTFVRKSVAANPQDGGPIVVHCSAGVGRTGTYIVIDTMIKQAAAKQKLNVFGFLKHIRSQRNHLVQTEEQYVFIHDALVEALSIGVTEIALDSISDFIAKLNSPVGEVNSTLLLDKHFNLVVDFVPSDYEYVAAKGESNIRKNRVSGLLPIESTRVALAATPGMGDSDYINASWMEGYDKVKEFIVTQHPTCETRVDFWKMLWDHKAQSVVLLTPLSDDFPVFWPIKLEEHDMDYLKVKFIKEAIYEGHSTLDFVVSSLYDDYELKVRIIHFNGCPYTEGSKYEVLDAVNLVQDWHLEYQNGPLVVVDRYGGTDAATFCALTTLQKQLKREGSVDVYQVCKMCHKTRPGIWSQSEDYLNIYKVFESLTQAKDENKKILLNGYSSVHTQGNRCMVKEVHGRDVTVVGPGVDILPTTYIYAAFIISILGVMLGQLFI